MWVPLLFASQVSHKVNRMSTLDEHLSWKSHIAYLASKVSRSLGVISKSSFCLYKSALRTLYFSLVHPYLQYCISVWGSTYPTNLKRLVLLQKRAMRIISKSCYDAHTEPIFKSCCILPLNDMYLAEIGKIMFQYKTGSLPDVFSNTFLRRNQVHNYDTRNASSFHVPKCRTNIRRFSFQYQGPLFFNSLSPDVVSSVSVSTFKKNLKKLLLS